MRELSSDLDVNNNESLLCEIHDFEAFSTQDDDPGFQEDESVRLGWQEEVLLE